MTTLLPERVSLLLSRIRCAAPSFSRRNSLGCFVSVTTVAIVTSHPLAANALTAQETVRSTMPTAVQIDNPLAGGSHFSIESGIIIGCHLCWERNVLASREQDPPVPRPTPPGGSR